MLRHMWFESICYVIYLFSGKKIYFFTTGYVQHYCLIIDIGQIHL
jgi:hypothetical protein